MVNIDKLDRIHVRDIDLLFEWRDNHKEYVRNFKPVMKTGLIIVYTGKDVGAKQVFEDKGDKWLYTMLGKERGTPIHILEWDKVTKVGKMTFSTIEDNGEWFEQYNESIISLHASLMAYMEYYSDNKDYVDVSRETTTKTKKRKKKGKSSNTIKISRKVYNVQATKQSASFNKRTYERRMKGWRVAGHWRQYKDGRKVWIEPYAKGDNKDVSPKNYRL